MNIKVKDDSRCEMASFSEVHKRVVQKMRFPKALERVFMVGTREI